MKYEASDTKYKIGDKVKIKMREEYCPEAKIAVINLPGGFGTITKINTSSLGLTGYSYTIDEMYWQWRDEHIESLAESSVEPLVESPVEEIDRFELIDLD